MGLYRNTVFYFLFHAVFFYLCIFLFSFFLFFFFVVLFLFQNSILRSLFSFRWSPIFFLLLPLKTRSFIGLFVGTMEMKYEIFTPNCARSKYLEYENKFHAGRLHRINRIIIMLCVVVQFACNCYVYTETRYNNVIYFGYWKLSA